MTITPAAEPDRSMHYQDCKLAKLQQLVEQVQLKYSVLFAEKHLGAFYENFMVFSLLLLPRTKQLRLASKSEQSKI
jgi:hypothetical protein